MNYKALEDLINILVKKSGTDLSVQVVSNEVARLEEKKKKLVKEKNKLDDKLEKGDYVLQTDKDKDLNEKGYLEKMIKLLNQEKDEYYSELEGFNRILESGETYFNSLKEDIRKFNKLAKKLMIKNEMKPSDEVKNEYNETLESIHAKEKEVNRKKYLEEEIVRVEDEINSNTIRLNEVAKKVSESNYTDDLTFNKDKLMLDNCKREIEIVDASIEMWQNSAEVLGGKILDAFKSNKDISDVKSEIDTLVKMANCELKCTQEEINGSNIFEIIDNYEKLSVNLKGKVSSYNYDNEEEKNRIHVKQSYHKEKISKCKANLEGINSRKAEVLNLISVSKNLSEDVKQARMCSENELSYLESRLYGVNTLDVSDEELKNIDNLIGEIKVDIENNKYLENEYIDDIYAYKEELKNLDINYSTLQNEISKEEKILEILNSEISSNDICENKIDKLADSVLLIEYNERLKSLKNQQQYLYVDSKVIKEEIYNLWKRSGSSDREEIVEEKKKKEDKEDIVEVNEPVVEETEIEEVSDSSDNVTNDSEMEVLDDFEFTDLSE